MTSVQAPAKINLTLEVLGRRDDGYHGIRSVMVPLELADELSVEPSSEFSFACDRSDLNDERNLAYAAIRFLGISPAVRIELRKRIPTQAGLGGGSSDAAAILRLAMSGAFGEELGRDWIAIARALGSDVPFFLAGTAALVEGTGERVTPAGATPRWHAAIVKPPVTMSTAAAYAMIDRVERPQRSRNASVSIAMIEALQRDDFTVVESLLQNDFHGVIVAQSDEVRAAIAALRSAGATNAMLAGSGSCVFSLAPDRAQIDAIVQRLDLAPAYERFSTAFAATSQWRK